METVFEATVRTEETPEALIVIVDVPGFRRKDVRVQFDEQRNLIISGERSANEMEEGGRLDITQSGRRTFRKVISLPENVNVDDISSKLKNQVLHVSVPFVQKNQKLLTEYVNVGGKPHVDVGGKPHVADLSEQSKQYERSNPLKQQGLMQERPAATQNHEGAKLPEVIRADDHKEKANETPEESKSEDIVHGQQPSSTHTQAVSAVEAGSDGDQSHLIQSKSEEPAKHDNEFPERRIHVPSSTRPRTMFLVASTLLVLCAAKYLSKSKLKN